MKNCLERFSPRSLFHGCSVVVVILLLLLGSFGLFYVNDLQMYHGNGNDCLAKNTIALYGQDNVLYCPNTYFVTSLNVTDFTLGLIAFTSNSKQSDMNTAFATTLNSPNMALSLDSSAQTYWYFNLNPGSSVDISLTGVTSSRLKLYVDGDDFGKIAEGDSSFAFDADESKGYKVEFKSSNITEAKTDVGYISFSINQTSYTSLQSNTSTLTCLSKLSCYWEFESGDDVCISFNYLHTRDWSAESSGNCLLIVQTAVNGWGWFLLVVAALLILLIAIINGFVAVVVHNQNLNKWEYN